MTVLGIEVDSVAEVIQLPDMKFTELLATLATWSIRTECTKRELLSLIGSLSFASKVVQPAWPDLHSLPLRPELHSTSIVY